MSNESVMPVVKRPLLIVLSAPSGAGKTTLCQKWLAQSEKLVYSVSCTTRKPRPGEEHSKSYHFLAESEFTARVARGDFIEYAVVHGNYYGTLKETVIQAMRKGLDIVMAIDVQGAATIRSHALSPNADPLIRNGYTDIFVVPPSFDVLRDRLLKRGTDSSDVIATRMRNAIGEMERWRDYRYVVVNDDLNDALGRLSAIRQAEHCRIVSDAKVPEKPD